MNFLASNGSDLLDLDARAILQGCSLLPGFIALTFTLYYIPGYEWLWMVIMISKSPFAKSLSSLDPVLVEEFEDFLDLFIWNCLGSIGADLQLLRLRC